MDTTTARYGGWRNKKNPFLFGIEKNHLFICGTIGLASLFIFQLNQLAGVIGFIIFVNAAICSIPIAGRSILSFLATEVTSRFNLSRGYGKSVTSAAVPGLPPEDIGLPGSLANTKTITFNQGQSKVGAVTLGDKITVTWLVDSNNGLLADDEKVESWVNNWNVFLGSFCDQPIIDHASVTVSTQIEPSCLMTTHVESKIDFSAPRAGRKLLRELLETEKAGTPLVETRVSICFDTLKGEQAKESFTQRVDEVAGLVSDIQRQLENCGVLNARIATDFELAGILRATYAPNERLDIQQALVEQDAETMIWEHSEPIRSAETRNWFEHEDHRTAAFYWTGAPKDHVPSTVLHRLLTPAKYPKNVTFIYKPIPSDKAAKILERRKQSIKMLEVLRGKMQQESTARERIAAQEAETAADEEAKGAGLIDMTLLVTTTVSQEEDLPQAISLVKSAAASSKISLKKATASHGAFLAATVPAGITPQDLTTNKLADAWEDIR